MHRHFATHAGPLLGTTGTSRYRGPFSTPIDTYFATKIVTQQLAVTKTPFQFNAFQAGVFGDMAKDSGSLLLPLAFPKPPEMVSYRVDSPGGLESLRSDFNANVKDSKKLVLGEFKKVQQWMNQEFEFGEAWLRHADGSVERARTGIVRHIEKLRDDWANKWEFFGKTPHPISRMSLAALYERA